MEKEMNYPFEELEQLRILKNLIMSDEFIGQCDLQKLIKAMDKRRLDENE